MKAGRFLAVVVAFLMIFAVMPVSLEAGAPPPEEEEPVITITDDDVDKMYFPGDELEFTITGLGTLEKVWLAFYAAQGPGEYEAAKIIDGLTLDDGRYVLEVDVVDGEAVVSGIIQADIPTGAIALHGRFEAEAPWQDIGPLEHDLDGEKIHAIVGIPYDFGDVSSNINELENLYDTEAPLVFTKDGMGSITFEAGLDIFAHYEQLAGLEDFLTIEFNEEANTVTASVTTSQLEFLSGVGAVIEFFKITELLGLEDVTALNFQDYMIIEVYGEDGELVADASEYFDWDEASYDATTDILTLPVKHFTDYVLGEVEDETPVTGTGIMWLIPFGMLMLLAGAFVIRKKLMA